MNGGNVPVQSLRLIRLTLVGGVLVFGVVIAYLTGNGTYTPDPELAGPLRLGFLVLCVSTLGALGVVRAMQAKAEPDRRAAFAIVGWALGEGLALFGGVAWLLAGERLLYLTGLAVLIAAVLVVPVPEDN